MNASPIDQRFGLFGAQLLQRRGPHNTKPVWLAENREPLTCMKGTVTEHYEHGTAKEASAFRSQANATRALFEDPV
jgi:hypothetical protein